MNFSTTTLALLYVYQLPVVFFGSFFLGESVIIPAAFLSGEGIWSFSYVFVTAYIGTLLSDAVWFALGPRLFRFAHDFESIKRRSDAFLPKIEYLGNRPFHLLLISKFIYGTRILTIIYLSKKVSILLFTLYNLVGTFLWLAAVMTVGFLAGKSVINLLPIFTDVKYLAAGIVVLVIGVNIFNRWIRKRFEKREFPPN